MSKKEGLLILIVLVILVLPITSAYEGKSASYDITVSALSVGGFEYTKAPNTSKHFLIDYMPLRSGNSTNYTVDLGISRKLGPIAFNISIAPEIANANSIINCTGKNIFSDKEMPKSWYRFSKTNGSYYTGWSTSGIFDCTSVGGCVDGNLTCHYKVDDSHLNSTEVVKTIPVDTVMPSVNLQSPPNQTIWNQSIVVLFEYNVTDNQNISSCYLILNGSVKDTDDSIIMGITQNFTVILEKGSYIWSVNCTDPAGNAAESEKREITQNNGDLMIIENIGVTGFEALNPEYTYTVSVILTLELATTSTECRFRNAESNWSGWHACDTVNYWTLPSGNGYKTVVVQINHTGVDEGIISSYSDGIFLESGGEHLDTTPPESFIVYDQGDYTNNYNNYHANWNLPRDRESQILEKDLTYYYKLVDANGTDMTLWNQTTLRTVTIHNLDLAENHTYVLYVNATNSAGLASQSTSDGIIIDLTPPIIINISADLLENAWTNINDLNLNWSAIDNISGAASYSMIIDDANDTTPDIVPETANLTILYQDLADGIYYFHIRPIDMADNIGNTYHYGPIKIDTVPPSVPTPLTSILVGDGNNITFYWTASTDALSGVLNYTINITDMQTNISTITNTTITNYTFAGSVQDHVYYIIVIARDLAGNTIQSVVPEISPVQILSATPNTTASTLYDDPIIKVETSKGATCRQNYTNKEFAYTGQTYHETKLIHSDGQYYVKITCIDDDDYTDTEIIIYKINKTLTISTLTIGAVNNTFIGKEIIVPVTVTNIANINKNRFKLYLNDTPIDDFTLVDVDNAGNYNMIFTSRNPGSYLLNVTLSALSDTVYINISDVKLNLKISGISGYSSESKLTYSDISGKKVGLASDASETLISSNAANLMIDSDTNGLSYVFFTKDFNAKRKNIDLKNNQFLQRSNAFGYSKDHDYNINAEIEYAKLKIEGIEHLQQGTYNLFIRNDGFINNKTVLYFEIG